jgi:hypothetical protein
MHIDSQRFLYIKVCDPIQITIQVHIERESQGVLVPALQGQIELLHSKGLNLAWVYMDPQCALWSLAAKFENGVIDLGSAGDYIPKVDAKIRRIKERYQSVKASLRLNLPPMMVKDLVAFVFSRINIERSMAINRNVAPKVLFTGNRLDFKRKYHVLIVIVKLKHERLKQIS